MSPTWRALTVVGAAVVAVAVMGVAYLGRGPASSPSRPTPLPGPRDFWSLRLASFGDAEHGVVVLSDRTGGDTYVTADGGRDWMPRHIGISATEFLDRTDAIAVEPTPRLESTADAGRSWTIGSTPVAGVALGLYLNGTAGAPDFLDPANGWWLTGAPQPGSSLLWRTGDGGHTWRSLPANGIPADAELGQPTFVDPLRGAVVVGPPTGAWPSLVTTQDGGLTWRPASLPGPPGDYFDGRGANRPVMLVLGGRLVLSLAMGTAAGAVARWTTVSDDGGLAWSPWSRQPDSTMSPGTPTPDDEGRLLLADGRQLWISGDAGRTWHREPLNLPSSGQAVVVVLGSRGVLIVAAQRSTSDRHVALFQSADAGRHWSEIHLPHEAFAASMA